MASNTYYSPFFPAVEDEGAKGTTIAAVPSTVVQGMQEDLQAIQDNMDTVLTSPIFDGEAPDKVANLVLTTSITIGEKGEDVVALIATWNKAANADVTRYDLNIKENSGNYVLFTTGVVENSSTQTYQWSVRANQTFTVQVRAVDAVGNTGPWSDVKTLVSAKDTTPPAAPTSLNAATSLGSVFLRWANPSDKDLTHVHVYENTTNNSATSTYYATVNAEPSTNGGYTRTGLTAGGTRWFFLRAVDSSGNHSVYSAGLSVTIPSLSETDFTPTASGLAPVLIVSSLPTTGNYEGRQAAFNGKLYRYTSGAWKTGVDAPDITGQVSNTQIANLAIDTAKFATGIEPVTNVTSVPATKSTSTIFNTTDGKLYRWNGTAYTKAVDGGDLSGLKTIDGSLIKDQAIDITKFASSIEPVTNVTSVPATKSTNNIYNSTDGKLYRWDAAATPPKYVATIAAGDIAGSITSTQITSITGDKITGSITAATLPAAKITGTIANTQLDPIATTKLSGTVTSAQIASLDASKLTSQIATTQISDLAISTPKIAVGAVTASTIAAGSIVASKLALVGENLWGDPQVQDMDWWKGPTRGTYPDPGYVLPANTPNTPPAGWQLISDVAALSTRTGGGKGYWHLWSNAGAGFVGTDYAQIVPPSQRAKSNTTYEFGFGCTNSSNKTLFCTLQCYDGAGNQISVGELTSFPAGDTTTIYKRVKFVTPPTCASIRIYWEVRPGAAFSGFITVGNISWREAASATMIVDGTITADQMAANSITTNKLVVASRPLSTFGLNMRVVTVGTTNTLTWDNGWIQYVNDAGNYVSTQVIAGTLVWPGSARFFTYTPGTNTLTPNTSETVQAETNKFHIGTWVSPTDFIAKAGVGTLINGDRIVTGTITASQMAANSISANKLAVANRPISTFGLNLRVVTSGSTNTLTWDSGYIQYTTDTGTYASTQIASGTLAWNGQAQYFTYTPGQTAIVPGAESVLADTTKFHIGTWISPTDFLPKAGVGTLINGDRIVTGTIDASKIVANSIDAGQIKANSITANKMVFATRPFSVVGVNIRIGIDNKLYWDAGVLHCQNSDGNYVSYPIAASPSGGITYPGNRLYIVYIPGQASFDYNTDAALIASNTAVHIATWSAGANLDVKAGVATLINGDKIVTGSLQADKIVAYSIKATQLDADSVTAGKIAALAVNTRELVAGAVTTNKLVVMPDSLILDPYFKDELLWTETGHDSGGWYFETIGNAATMNVPKCITIGPRGAVRKHVWGRMREYSGTNQKLRLRASGLNSGADTIAVGIRFYNASNTEIGGGDVAFAANSGFSTRYGLIDVPAAAVKFRTVIYNGGDVASGNFWSSISEVKLDVATTGELIVPGTITTDHLAANTITASKLSIQSRPFSTVGLNMRVHTDGKLYWDSGYIQYQEAGVYQAPTITANTAGLTFPGSFLYIVYLPGRPGLDYTTDPNILANSSYFHVATWSGDSALAVQGGVGTIIHGDRIVTGSIHANKITALSIGADQITGNTITGGKLIAGAINTREIFAGAITTDKLAIGTGANMLVGAGLGANPNNFLRFDYNPDNVTYAQGTLGQYFQSPNYGFSNTDWGVWGLPDGTTFALQQPNAATGTTGYSDFRIVTNKDTAGNKVHTFPVEAGKYYEASLWTGTHRCSARIYLEFRNGADAIIGYSATTAEAANANEKAGGNNLDGYKRIVARAVAPAGATWVSVLIRKYHTSSGSDSWLFMAKPMLGVTVPNATQMLPWSAPGHSIIQGDSIVTGSLHANRIVAGTISATELGANSITAGKIKAGEIQTGHIATDAITAAHIQAGAISTSELAAGAITASKLGIRGENLWPDQQCQDISWWKGPSQGTLTDPGYVNPANNLNDYPAGWTMYPNVGTLGSRVGGAKGYWQLWSGNNGEGYRGTGYAQVVPPSLMAKPSTTYELGFGCTNSSNKNLAINVQYFDVTGAYISGVNLINWAAGDTTTIYYRAQFTTPANCNTIRVYFEVAEGGPAFFGFISAGNISVREAASGTMIVDGTIAAKHIIANGITGDVITAGTLNADRIKTNTSLPGQIYIGSTGVTIETVRTTASNAESAVNAISNDNILSKGEKSALVKEHSAIVGEEWHLSDLAAVTGISPAPLNAARVELFTYLDSLNPAYNNLSADTTIDGNVFRAKFTNYYNHKINLVREASAKGYNTASSALTTANNAVNAINAISNDNILSKAEKPAIMKEHAVIVGEESHLSDQAAVTGVNVGPLNAARVELFTYLASLSPAWNDLSTDTNINGAEFRGKFANYYNHKINLLRLSTNKTYGYANDPAAVVNNRGTTIDPGKIQISGGTTLASWRSGGDNTKIEGGNIAANTVRANSLRIGSRGITLNNIDFEVVNGTLYQTAGYVEYIADNGNLTSVLIPANAWAWPGAWAFVYWEKDAAGFALTTDYNLAHVGNGNMMAIATWTGGNRVVTSYGGTVINGDRITTGSITANNIAAQAITAEKVAATNVITSSAQIGNAVIQSANIGNLQVKNANIENLTIGTEKVGNNAITAPWYTSSDTQVFSQQNVKKQLLSIDIYKATSDSILEVNAQVPSWGSDAVQLYIDYELWQNGGVIAARTFTLKNDANNDTALPFLYQHHFFNIGAGNYQVKVFTTQIGTNSSRTDGLYHMLVREYKK